MDLVASRIVAPSKIKIIPNPVLPGDFEARSLEHTDEEWFADKSLEVVLGVGRLVPHKGFDFLIRSFRVVLQNRDSARLLIVGQGPERESLAALVTELDLDGRVKFAGTKANVFPYFRSARLFALTSWYEGFGNVVVEALSVGTPVVSVDCPGGPRGILEGGRFGRLVAPGDIAAFADALVAGLEDSETESLILRKRAKDFTVERVAEEYLAVITGRENPERI